MGQIRTRSVIAVTIAGAAVLILAVANILSGEYVASPSQILAALTGSGTSVDQAVLVSLRTPRALLALAVGAALGISGAIAQAVARNDLATPELLGVTGGASVGAVGVIVLGGGAGQFSGFVRGVGIPLAAILGGAFAAAIILVILRAVGTTGPAPILVGIGLSATFAGLVSWLLVAASLDDLRRANVWLTGSLNGRSWPELWSVTVVLAVCVLALLPVVRHLNTLILGDDVARGLGVPIGAATAVLLLVAVVLAAVSTAAVGPIAFVALVAPHLARIVERRPRAGLLLSALIGAALLAGSDLAARTIASVQLPSGAVTAIVGAPFLIFLLLQQRREHR